MFGMNVHFYAAYGTTVYVHIYVLLLVWMVRDMQNMYAIQKNNYNFHHQLNTIRIVPPITRHFKFHFFTVDACTLHTRWMNELERR